jgi:hypothetical protein
MARQVTLVGTLAGGRITLDKAVVRAALSDWPDGTVEIRITPASKNRSIRQLRYYWGRVLPMIADYTGHHVDDIHLDMCGRFLTRREIDYVNPLTGEIEEREVSGRTTGLKAPEMYEFTEKVRIWAGEWLGIVIPPPEGEIKHEHDQ